MARIAFYTQAYNSEKYLRKCMESVLNQTFKDFCYYVADNGSTDSTREIIKEYAAIDNRIIPIFIDVNNQINTYNSSLKLIYQSEHDFLSILDSDDWYELNYAEEMIGGVDPFGSELVICASLFISEETSKSLGRRGSDCNLFLEKNAISAKFEYLYQFFRAVWGKLYQISTLREYGIFLNENVGYGADTLFVLEYIKHIDKIALLKNVMHNYTVRSNSDSYSYRPSRLEDDIYLYNEGLEYLKHIDGLSTRNILFLSIVYINAFMDSTKMFLKSNCTQQERINGITDVFSHPLTQKIWQTVLGDCIGEMERELSSFILNTKLAILTMIISIYDTSQLEKIYSLIKFLCPEVDDFWDCNDVSEWVGNRSIENNFLLGNFDKVYSALKEMPGKKKIDFYRRMEFYLALKLETNKSQIARMYSVCSKALSDKQLRFMISHNAMLKNIEGSDLLKHSPGIISAVLGENYQKASNLLYDKLNEDEELDLSVVTAFNQVLLYVSAITADSEKFVFAKKVQALIASENGDQLEYENIMAELNEMVQ